MMAVYTYNGVPTSCLVDEASMLPEAGRLGRLHELSIYIDGAAAASVGRDFRT